jgi:hypothetical protein
MIELASLLIQIVSPEQRGEARLGTLNLVVSSLKHFLIGMNCLAHWLCIIYAASQVESLIYVWSLLSQKTRQLL